MCYPATWESQAEMVELKPVPPGSNEWKSIIDRIHKTLPSAEVRMLQQIQNQLMALGKVFFIKGTNGRSQRKNQ